MSSDIKITPTDFRSFIAWEAASRDTIDFKKIYVDVSGDLKAGLLLSQLLYWRLPSKQRDTKLTVERESRLWLAKADADWWAEIRLTPHEARGARLILEEREIITCKTWKFYGNTTTHISLNEEKFLELMAETIAIDEEVRNAGRLSDKLKRPSARKPGSKPTSGNRTPRAAADADPQDPGAPEDGDPLERQNGNYENHNSRITERVIPELRKPQSRNYGEGNSGIMENGIPYTETPAESSSETPVIIISTLEGDARATPGPDDDDRVAEAGKGTTLSSPPAVEGGEALLLSAPGQDDRQGKQAETQSPVLEEAPGGAGRSALLALTPVSRAELEARDPRDPVTMKALRAILFCSNKARLDELRLLLNRTTPGRIPRELFARLTDAEIQRVVEAARQDMTIDTKGRPFEVLAQLGLDRMIGESLTLAMITGLQEPIALSAAGPNGQSLCLAEERSRVEGERPEVVEGSIWYGRKSGRPYRVLEVAGGDVTVEGIETSYAPDRFHANFMHQPPEQASA